MRFEIRSSETLAAGNGFDQLAASIGQLGIGQPKGRELLAAIRAEKRELAKWTHGWGATRIVFMDNHKLTFGYDDRPHDWAKYELLGSGYDPKFFEENEYAGSAEYYEYGSVLGAFRWNTPAQPRDLDKIAKNMEESSGLFCRERRDGDCPSHMVSIARNYARILERPVAWFCDDGISLATARARRDAFAGLPVTLFADGQKLNSAVWDFAARLAGGERYPPYLEHLLSPVKARQS